MWNVECLECLGLVGTAQDIKNLFANSMNGWKTELTSNGQSLGDVNIKRYLSRGFHVTIIACDSNDPSLPHP